VRVREREREREKRQDSTKYITILHSLFDLIRRTIDISMSFHHILLSTSTMSVISTASFLFF
jgi:hypothetical protein